MPIKKQKENQLIWIQVNWYKIKAILLSY